MSGPYRRIVVFLLRHARIVQLKIREIWRRMTGYTVPDLTGGQFRCGRGNRRRLCKKYLEACQPMSSKNKTLAGVELESPLKVGWVTGVRCHELWASQYIHKCQETAAVV